MIILKYIKIKYMCIYNFIKLHMNFKTNIIV